MPPLQTGAGLRYKFFRIEYQGPRNIPYSSRAERNEGLKLARKRYYADSGAVEPKDEQNAEEGRTTVAKEARDAQRA